MGRLGTGRRAALRGAEKGGADEAAKRIPDKLYFRIGEAAALCDVPTYVLRFWESEFPQLKPNKGGSGQRLYRRQDVEMALRIRGLLYERKLTIPGARQVLKGEQRRVEPQLSLGIMDVEPEGSDPLDRRRLRLLRRQMEELLEVLGGAPSRGRRVAVQPIRGARAKVASVEMQRLFE